MKNRLLLIPLISMSFTLTACPFSFGDPNEWKKERGTPELFLDNVTGNKYVYLYDENSKNYTKDEDLSIRDLIKESGPFESSNQSSSTAERYFTYQGYWQAATSGPNYCYMSIWEDGLIKIHHKYSLGAHAYLYFSMDPIKASHINDVVFEKIPLNQE